MLNDTYDFLVKTDFRLTAVPSKAQEAISDSIRIIAFDKESCEESPGQGFWTPRERLGKTIIKAIERGAKVVCRRGASANIGAWELNRLMDA